MLDVYAPWNRFDGKLPFEEPQIGDSFVYADRLFTYIKAIGERDGRSVRVWQVNKL